MRIPRRTSRVVLLLAWPYTLWRWWTTPLCDCPTWPALITLGPCSCGDADA